MRLKGQQRMQNRPLTLGEYLWWALVVAVLYAACQIPTTEPKPTNARATAQEIINR